MNKNLQGPLQKVKKSVVLWSWVMMSEWEWMSEKLVMTFRIKKRINAELLIDGMAALHKV